MNNLGNIGGQNNGMSLQEQQTIRMLQGAFESCPVKTAMSGVMGNNLFISLLDMRSKYINDH